MYHKRTTADYVEAGLWILLLASIAGAVFLLAVTCGCRCIVITGDNSSAGIEGGAEVRPSVEMKDNKTKAY